MKRFDPARLRAVRTERGLSQGQLAKRLGHERGRITAYENGRHTPRGSSLFAIAQVLDVDVTELLRPGPVDLPVLRLRRNLTQAEVAQALGVTQAWYQLIEAQQGKIDRAQLRRLAALLQVDEGTVEKLVLVRGADA